jgi:type II secretory pathway component GspD/PulD (secretin)
MIRYYPILPSGFARSQVNTSPPFSNKVVVAMNRCAIFLIATIFGVLVFPDAFYAQEATTQPPVRVLLVRAEAIEAAKKLKAVLGNDAEVYADKVTNSVFIRASAEEFQRAKEILKRWDAPQSLNIYQIKNADAEKTAKTLKAILALLAILGDDREVRLAASDGAIIFQANREKAAEVTAIIRWLDAKKN